VQGLPMEGAIESSDIKNDLQKLGKNNIFKVRYNRVSARQLKYPLKDELLIHFLTQLHRLLDSGLEIVDSLNFIIRYQANTLFGYILCFLRQDIQEGHSLTDSFKRHGSAFPSILIHLIQVAENSGKLKEVVAELISFFSFQSKIVQERRKLMTYPMVVTFIALFLFLGILLFVVPAFKGMFISLGDDLPSTTKVMMALSDSIRFDPVFWITGCVVTIAGLKYIDGRWGWGWILRFIPGFYAIEHATKLLFYSRSMAIMLRSGTKFKEALELSEKLFSKKRQVEVRVIHKQIESGKLLAEAYGSSKFFPPLFVHIIAVGESSGHLTPAYDRIATLFQEKIEKRMNIVNSMMEPIFTLSLAIGILIVLLSIYLPIFSMAEHF